MLEAKKMSKKELKQTRCGCWNDKRYPYEYKTYECEEFVSGIFTADQTGLPHELVYKTLVTTGKTGAHYAL